MARPGAYQQSRGMYSGIDFGTSHAKTSRSKFMGLLHIFATDQNPTYACDSSMQAFIDAARLGAIVFGAGVLASTPASAATARIVSP